MEAKLKNSLQKLDKEEVMRRILLNQLEELELQELVRDYKFDLGMFRCVYIIRTRGMEADTIYTMLLKAFPRNQGDTLVMVDGMTVSLVKAVTREMEEDDLLQLAAAIDETIENETSIKAYIGIGGVKENLFSSRIHMMRPPRQLKSEGYTTPATGSTCTAPCCWSVSFSSLNLCESTARFVR